MARASCSCSAPMQEVLKKKSNRMQVKLLSWDIKNKNSRVGVTYWWNTLCESQQKISLHPGIIILVITGIPINAESLSLCCPVLDNVLYKCVNLRPDEDDWYCYWWTLASPVKESFAVAPAGIQQHANYRVCIVKHFITNCELSAKCQCSVFNVPQTRYPTEE